MKGGAHARHSIYAAPVAGVGAFFLTGSSSASAFAALGSLSGVPLTPDLDQQGVSRSEWQIVKHTYGLGWLWVMYWYPYSLIFRHRGVSHRPVLGTLTRLLWLTPLWLMIGVPEPAFVAGLMLSDLIHWAADLLPRKREPEPAYKYQMVQMTRDRYRGCYYQCPICGWRGWSAFGHARKHWEGHHAGDNK